MRSSPAVAKEHCHDCSKELGFWGRLIPDKSWNLPHDSLLCSSCWEKRHKQQKEEPVTVGLMDGEKVLWEKPARKSFFDSTLVELWRITSHRVIKNKEAIDIALIEDAAVLNEFTEELGGDVITDHYDEFSISSRSSPAVFHFGDVAFLHKGEQLIVFPRVLDPEKIAQIFKAAKQEAVERLTPEDEDEEREKKKPVFFKCPHCGTKNLPADACNACGKPLNPMVCQSCKIENPQGSYFCAACGMGLTVL